MFKNADPLAVAILTAYAIGLVISLIVLGVGIWLARKMYRRLRARGQRFAGLFSFGAFMLLLVFVVLTFSIVLDVRIF